MSRLTETKWLWPVLLLPGVVLMLVSVGMRINSEIQHDEAECPFVEVTQQSAGDADVLEERRNCEDGVEERRWLVVRDGERLELGRRRLGLALYVTPGYHWSARESEEGLIEVTVVNPGVSDQQLVEPSVRPVRP